MGEIITSAEMRALLRRTIGDRQKKGREETFFFWHDKAHQVMWGNNPELIEQMKIWRKQYKNKQIKIMPYNNITKQIQGENWYILTVQNYYEKPCNPCRLGLGFDGGAYLVGGCTYIFKHEHNRDATYKYVMGVK